MLEGSEKNCELEKLISYFVDEIDVVASVLVALSSERISTDALYAIQINSKSLIVMS